MNNPIELAVHQYLSKVKNADSILSEEIIDQITSDVRTALIKQFVDKRDTKFRLRMSNIGRSYCQLWFDKNKPEKAISPSSNFVINMMIGDIVEAIFKGLLKAAGVSYKDGENVTLDLGSSGEIKGTPDIIIDDMVDDIKSASPWSYQNKFKDYESLADKDSLGYVAQLAGYAKAMNKKPNGWWVINKATGEFKHVSSNGKIDTNKFVAKTKQLIKDLKTNKFRRCYEDVPETYRKKPSGNRKLGIECSFCSYRHSCWPNLKERPSVVSQAQEPPMVCYTELNNV